jgi:hypothetical protein
VAPTCLSITTSHDGQNTFVSPYFNCPTAVNATASTRNLLINPTYAGGVTNRGPQATGVQVVGTGSWAVWQFPSVASYTASGIDDGTAISPYNAPGASLAVTLPAPNAVNAGWRMGFATDNGKGLTVTAPSGSIVSGGKALSSVRSAPAITNISSCNRTAAISGSSPARETHSPPTGCKAVTGRAIGSTRQHQATRRSSATTAMSCPVSIRRPG